METIDPRKIEAGHEIGVGSEEIFSRVFNAAPAILAITTLADGRFVQVNEAFLQVFGYRREEVIGRTSLELNIWETPEVRAGIIKTLQESGKIRDLEVMFRDKTGTLSVGLYSAEIVEIGGERYLLSLQSDITVRKRMEDALRKSEERFRHLYNDTPVMLHSIDQDGCLVSVSDYWLEVLGYERDEVIGRRSTYFLTEASRRYAQEVVLPDFLRTGFCKDVPYQIVTKRGKILDILLSATVELDSAGKVVRSLAVMTDVTERKRAEEALRASEEKFSHAFRSTPTILVISTLADGRYIEVNEAFERFLGYDREEAIGRTSVELGIWEDPADRKRYVQALRDKGSVRDMELNLRSKSGEIMVGLLSGEIIEMGGEERLLTMVSDITARKRAEEALQASEERYRRIVDTSQEGILVIDAEARLTYVNQRMAEMVGRERSEVVGRSYLDFIDGSMRGEVGERLQNRKKGLREQYETIFLHDDGSRMWVSISATPIVGASGEFTGSFAMVSDVSDRKRAAEQIEVLNTDLAARASELEMANEELEAFSYTVSHDLRKPLTAISGYSQLILEVCGTTLDADCQGYLREIVGSSDRMSQLIDTLLDFSRLSRGELHRETVDLSAMARAIVAELPLDSPQRRVSWAVAPGVVVNGDAKLLRVVMDNLLGNAWKYTAKTEEARIEFGSMAQRGKTVCFVRDNGVGFNMAHANRLFAVFQRLHSASEFEGTGIGLATVQRIIQRHGGRVWAEGDVGKGATIYFTLG